MQLLSAIETMHFDAMPMPSARWTSCFLRNRLPIRISMYIAIWQVRVFCLDTIFHAFLSWHGYRKEAAKTTKKMAVQCFQDRGSWQSLNLAQGALYIITVSYTHLRAHETPEHIVCRLLHEKKNSTSHPVHLYYSLPLLNTTSTHT